MPTWAARDRSPRLRPNGSRLPLLAAGATIAAALAWLNRRMARRAEARFPPSGRFVTVQGVRLHYVEEGLGPPLVLLHGLAVSAEDFVASGLVERLARRYRVVAFDRPGYGYSDRPRRKLWTADRQASLVLEAIGRLGLERPILVGHSYGALVAAHMGLKAPGALSGLALLSGCFRPTLRPDAGLIGLAATPLAGDLYCHTLSPWLTRAMAPLILKLVFAPAHVTASFSRGYPIPLACRPTQLHASATDIALVGWDAFRFSRRAEALKGPMLIIASPEDRVLSTKSHSAWLHRRATASRLLTLDDAGHMIHHTRPEAVAAAILRFADEAAAS